jgi:hypothetical protein
MAYDSIGIFNPNIYTYMQNTANTIFFNQYDKDLISKNQCGIHNNQITHKRLWHKVKTVSMITNPLALLVSNLNMQVDHEFI